MKIVYSCKKQRQFNYLTVKAVIVFILIAAVLHFLLPNYVKTQEDNCISAFNVLGEALSGERDIGEAVNEAFEYAFCQSDNSIIYVSGVNGGEKLEN